MMNNLCISEENKIKEKQSFAQIVKCIDNKDCFVFDAGAGSGKTYCLIQSLSYILSKYSSQLVAHNQIIRCITYTNVAAKEIKSRLGNTELVQVSTIHDFLWNEVNSYQKELVDIHKNYIKEELDSLEDKLKKEDWAKFYRELRDKNIFIEQLCTHSELYYKNKHKKASEFKEAINFIDKDCLVNVNNFKKVADNILKICKFRETIKNIDSKVKKDNINYTKVIYNSQISYDRLNAMQFSHDTLIRYSLDLIFNYETLQKIITDKYPYILIDEYQDTNPSVVKIIAKLSKFAKKDLLVGYYGDKKQNIYNEGVGDSLKTLHTDIKEIKKEYNRRSSKKIIDVGTLIRNDELKQKTIYDDCPEGNVSFYIGNNIDDFIRYHCTEWNITECNTLDCLVLKNEDIAYRLGFSDIYDFFKNSPYYQSGRNYVYLRDHILNKEVEKLGVVQSFIYRLIELRNRLKNPDTLIQVLVNNNILKDLSIGELRKLVHNLSKIEGNTLKNYTSSFFSMLLEGNANIRRVLKTFLNEEIINNEELFSNYIFEKLFNIDDEDTDDEKLDNYKRIISNFLDLNISIFDNWYNYLQNVRLSNIMYHTYHGTKGDEFDNVLIIMENDFGKAKNFFGNLIRNLSLSSGEENSELKAARNLFYVAVTRAKNNLAILYTDFLDDAQKEQIKNVFGEIDETTFKGAQNA